MSLVTKHEIKIIIYLKIYPILKKYTLHNYFFILCLNNLINVYHCVLDRNRLKSTCNPKHKINSFKMRQNFSAGELR